MGCVEEFAEEAAAFEKWAREGAGEGAVAVRTALERLMRLYLAAMALPMGVGGDAAGKGGDFRVNEEEWREVFLRCKRLPVDMYGVALNPLDVPPKDMGIGSVSDDVTDVYRDVVSGLRAYRAGHRERAVWEWRSGFETHWGEHTLGAMGTLHRWLVDTRNW